MLSCQPFCQVRTAAESVRFPIQNALLANLDMTGAQPLKFIPCYCVLLGPRPESCSSQISISYATSRASFGPEVCTCMF